jgi:hypothetical protein
MQPPQCTCEGCKLLILRKALLLLAWALLPLLEHFVLALVRPLPLPTLFSLQHTALLCCCCYWAVLGRYQVLRLHLHYFSAPLHLLLLLLLMLCSDSALDHWLADPLLIQMQLQNMYLLLSCYCC